MGAPAATASTIVAPNAESPSGVRVVVIDHRYDRRQLMSYVIGLGGDDVTVVGYAEDPAGAVDAVNRLDATAIVMEMQLPVDRALETIAALRRERPELRIVVCTFHDDADTRLAALAAGADVYLIKPLSPRDIYPLLLQQPA
ncbi:MAG: response regulator [Actinomycetes bacterium]